ncbi:MAG TPA: FRG domain-containing protein [Longimicrobium sp.]|nr:FRG domain-containing protein [Longimicrobium sp.]
MADHGFEDVEEVRIETLGELLDRVTPEAHDPVSGRLRGTWVFRGSKGPGWPLLTSLDRLGGAEPPHSKAHLEEHILRNFIRYSRPFLDRVPANEWELLVTAQHHGLPTRLLDWSYSPLIAAHFATLGGEPGADRVIWRLDWAALHEHFGLPPYAFLVQDLDAMLQSRGIRGLDDLLAGRVPDDAHFACMLDAPALDDRIQAQAATFTFSTDRTRSFETLLRDEGLTRALTRFVVPGENADLVRDQLDLCAIDERKLFPDLDGVAAQMRRYYSTSPAEDRPDGTP